MALSPNSTKAFDFLVVPDIWIIVSHCLGWQVVAAS